MEAPRNAQASDRRRSNRLDPPGVGLVHVFRLQKGMSTCLGPALLKDLSSGGVGIYMDVAIKPGETLAIRNRYVSYFATVRNCLRTDSGFQLGLEFTHVDDSVKKGRY